MDEKNIRQALSELKLADKKESITMRGPVVGDIENFKSYDLGLELSAKATATADPYQYRPCNFNMMALALEDEQADILIEKMNESRDLAFKMAKEKKRPTSLFYV